MDFLTQEELRTVAPLDFVDILKALMKRLLIRLSQKV